MLAAQELMWSTSLHMRPVCSNCGRPMHLVVAPTATATFGTHGSIAAGNAESGRRKPPSIGNQINSAVERETAGMSPRRIRPRAWGSLFTAGHNRTQVRRVMPDAR